MRRKTVNYAKNMICDSCALKWRRYEFSDISAHIVVISLETVKEAKNTICVTCALKWRRYEFSDISGHTVVISRETVKQANMIYDTSALKSRR